MTDEEKIARFEVLISPETASTALLQNLLWQAEGIVLNRRYPFGAPEWANVDSAYEHIQIQIAVELFAKMGAEGQTAHNENGVNRTYEAADVSPSLLRRIVPVAGSVLR